MDHHRIPREEDRPVGWWRRVLAPRRADTDNAAPGRRPELVRFAELLQAFVDLARERADLVLRGSALPPPLGFAVRLQPAPTSAGGELCLWLDGGRLTTWGRAGHPAARGSGERSLRLDLNGAFRWEALIFPDAERLACTMLRWMEDRIAGVARVEDPVGAAGELVNPEWGQR